ncbi:MAG: hypothetical protein WCP33_02165 [Deltaproteobacteria bacterium]
MSIAENQDSQQKHPCIDCICCQWCSDDRCRLCRKQTGRCRKLSLAEQIARYESLNRSAPGKDQILQKQSGFAVTTA